MSSSRGGGVGEREEVALVVLLVEGVDLGLRLLLVLLVGLGHLSLEGVGDGFTGLSLGEVGLAAA